MYGVFVYYDYGANEETHNYAKPTSYSGNYTQFEWWKSKMYTYIIGIDDELWDILEDGTDLVVDGVGMGKPPH